MTQRIRSSEIVIFCAFVLYTLAWVATRNVRDPLPIWDSVVQLHPEIRGSLYVVDGSGLIAFIALLAGGVPLLYVTLRNAYAEKRWGLLALLAWPLPAIIALAGYVGVASRFWTQQSAGEPPQAPFTPLAIALQLGLVILLFSVIVSSTAAITTAISKTSYTTRLVRILLIPAAIVTLGIVFGSLGTLILNVLILTEAPQLASPGILPFIALFMVVAIVLSVAALRRGVQAAKHSEIENGV